MPLVGPLIATSFVGARLSFVLIDWQGSGIALWLKRPDDDRGVAPYVLKRRSWFLRISDAVGVALLRRRSDGFYGRLIEPPSAS